MNKLFTLLFSLFFLSAAAQPNLLKSGVSPGTITTLDGKTLKGYIYNNGNADNQKQCVFYTDFADKQSRKVYRPTELLGYTIENVQYKSVSYSGNIGFGKPDKHFLYIANTGAINTYVYWTPEQMVWQKGDGEAVSNASMLLSFKKTILKLVGDNAELAAKIERKDKGYNLLGIEKIINEYNTWAASKTN